MGQQTFSEKLAYWLGKSSRRTLGSLDSVFAEKSFAILALLLMALPALPIPTGGITHVFELIVMLVCLEMIIGRRTLWLPKKWRTMQLGQATQKKAIPFLIRRIRWLEKYSRPRFVTTLQSNIFYSLAGAIMLILTLGAFIAPPFSGLDTLPSLGVVVISLSLIVEDGLLFIIGVIVGSIGLGIEGALGGVAFHALLHWISRK